MTMKLLRCCLTDNLSEPLMKLINMIYADLPIQIWLSSPLPICRMHGLLFVLVTPGDVTAMRLIAIIGFVLASFFCFAASVIRPVGRGIGWRGFVAGVCGLCHTV